MKQIRRLLAGAGLMGALLFFAAGIVAGLPLVTQNPVRSQPDRGLEGAPLNPLDELRRRSEREAREKRYNELKSSASELAELSRKVSEEIDKNGQDVVSAKVFENLDRIEKLVKQVRIKAKDAY
ncbi:MAG TPA: hypothetical protein VFY29_19765 [Terriglobia bacterium]|nr:hypothetical protein [Terriglobia bacterium]